jgi:pimeloyl-ACP methyl ester carboxylesterase
VHAVRQREDGSVVLKGDPALRRKDWRRPLRTHEENWAAARNVQRPTLVIRGAESKLLSAEVAERMTREMPQCSLVTIEGAGHAVPLHRPAEFEAVVRAWLSHG